MHKQSITIIQICLAVFCASVLAAELNAATYKGADDGAAFPMITLDVRNEPLQSVLGEITRKTRWKIKAPPSWLARPVTQTLNNAPLEEALRSVLNNAGIENLLVMHDESIRVVTIFETASPSASATASTSVQVPVQPPVVSPTREQDPILNRTVIDKRPGPARGSRRQRRQSSEED